MKKRIVQRRRPLAIENLERRDLLTDLYSAGFHFLTPASLSTSEQGHIVVVQCELTRAPVAGVTVSLTMSSSNPAEGLADGIPANTQTLSWDSTNWNLMKTFRMVGVNDPLDDGHIPYNMGFAITVTGAGDPYWKPAPAGSPAPAAIGLHNLDDDLVAVAETGNLNEDQGPTTIDVRANDTDIIGPGTAQDRSFIITAAWLTQGQGILTTDGSTVTYEPAENYNGPYNITYTISNTPYNTSMNLLGTSKTTTLSGNVLKLNDRPIANPDSATTEEDKGKLIDALGNDTDAPFLNESPNWALTWIGTTRIPNTAARSLS